jgi:hypothetical protein
MLESRTRQRSRTSDIPGPQTDERIDFLADPVKEQKSSNDYTVRRILALLTLGLAIFVLLEVLIFRPAFYGRFVEPRSYAGYMEMLVDRERTLTPDGSPFRMTILGDSRIAEGFSEKRAEEQENGRWRFINAAIPGSTPRVWYCILRETDPGRDRSDFVVVPLEDYPDLDTFEDLSNRMLDLRIAILHLGLSDLPALVRSVDDWGDRWQVVRTLLLKGGTLKKDLQDFLDDPARRFRRIEQYHKEWAHSRHEYPGRDESLEGLQYDPSSGRFVFPRSLPERQRALLLRSVKEPPQRGVMHRYRRTWLTAIADYYRGTSTHVIFLRMPRGPIVAPYRKGAASTGVVFQLAREPNVDVLPEHLFDALEKPCYFFDSVHMNRAGREKFTKILVRALDELQTSINRDHIAADQAATGT